MGVALRKRRRQQVEDAEFLRVVGRMLRAAGRRVATADEEELGELFHLEAMLGEILLEAVAGMRQSGATWEVIGNASGTTRQAALMRWKPKIEALRRNGQDR